MANYSCIYRHRLIKFVQNASKSPSVSLSRGHSQSAKAIDRLISSVEAISPQSLDPNIRVPTSTTNLSDTKDAKENVSSASVTVSELDIGKPLTVDARRVDPSTVRQVYYFDSLSFVKSLETKGFTRQQAEGMAEALTELINSTLDHQSRHMITKKQQEITVQQLMAEIVSVKKDMVLLQKSEFSQLRSETEKMGIELENLKRALTDEVTKLKGHVTLDINLERGRSVEAHANNASKLQELNNKIDTDIANLKTVFEQYRNDVLKYAGGTVLTCATVCLGVIRLWH
ncbi:mitochondrial calcium uniporter regulator 1-like [Babylonia areolata]|uniref:mitochondrial calcium uniporter regulator 1-like n=1 Tax=Babylonia areolata TaxID=304850 RepID=UPI003FD27D2C